MPRACGDLAREQMMSQRLHRPMPTPYATLQPSHMRMNHRGSPGPPPRPSIKPDAERPGRHITTTNQMQLRPTTKQPAHQPKRNQGRAGAPQIAHRGPTQGRQNQGSNPLPCGRGAPKPRRVRDAKGGQKRRDSRSPRSRQDPRPSSQLPFRKDHRRGSHLGKQPQALQGESKVQRPPTQI